MQQDGEQGLHGGLLVKGQELEAQCHQVLQIADNLLPHCPQTLMLTATAAAQTLLTVQAEHDLSLSM